MADHAATLRPLEDAGEKGVEAPHGGRRPARVELRLDELDDVLRADVDHPHGAEEGAQVDGPGLVGMERVRSGRWVPALGCEPGVDGLIDRLLRLGYERREFELREAPVRSGADVGVPPGDLPTDEPLAAALIPFGAGMPATLDEGGH